MSTRLIQEEYKRIIIEHPKRLFIGCKYNTTWQSDKRVSFILESIIGNQAWLLMNKNKFSVHIDKLIFINNKSNIKKAVELNRLR